MWAALYRALSGQLEPDVAERVAAISAGVSRYGYDKWGFSPNEMRRAMAIYSWLYRHYFRVDSHGIEHVPSGRGLLIGNHSSQLAYDGIMVAMAMLLDADPPRAVKAMIEKFFQRLPFVNVMMTRSGQLTGLPEHCKRLLDEEQLIMVFPEGARGGGKTVWERYQLQEFGTGFMRLAQQARAPIIPFGFIGGEELCPSLVDVKPVAKLLGMPYLPITPTILPLPLPAKCAVYFGEPLYFEPDDDEEAIRRDVDIVRDRIAGLIARGLAERSGIFT